MALTVATRQKFTPGIPITCVASAAVTAERLVSVSGDSQPDTANIPVSHSTATSMVLGVALHSAAIGELVAVLPVGSGGVVAVNVASAGAIAFGDAVKSNATGQLIVAVTTSDRCGIATHSAALSTTCYVALGV